MKYQEAIKRYGKMLQNVEDCYKLASYRKRIESGIIDICFAYLFYGLFNIKIPSILFFENLVTQFIFYKFFQKSLGNMILKISPVQLVEMKNKDLFYLLRAFLKCSIFFPLGLSTTTFIIAIILVVTSIGILVDDKTRHMNIFAWDMFTVMIVVEDIPKINR